MRALSRSTSALLLALVAAPSALVVALTPRTALADQQPSEQDIAQARQLAQQAQTSFEAGNFAESEKLWTAARRLYPAAPTLTLGLARTQARLGKVVAAQENYNRIIREGAASRNAPAAFAAAVDSAKAEIGAVSARIANVVITVEGPSEPTVKIDGQSIPAAALGLKRPVDPGTHAVTAEASGYKPGEAKFQVAEGGNAELKLTLEKGAADSVAAAGPATGPTTAQPSGTPGGSDGQATPASVDGGATASASAKKPPNKTIAIAAFGVGGAGLIAGAVTGILAAGKHGDLADRCPNNVCPPELQGDVDSYQTLGTISTVAFIVGGVGVAAGAVLWFTAPKEKPATTATNGLASLGGYVGLGSAGLRGTF